MDDEIVDLRNVRYPCLDKAWRKRAVELAVERNLVGQARIVDFETLPGVELYAVVSASEPLDRLVSYNSDTDQVSCDCNAGRFDKPCSHAGAVYLFVKGLAPERTRSATGV